MKVSVEVSTATHGGKLSHTGKYSSVWSLGLLCLCIIKAICLVYTTIVLVSIDLVHAYGL